MAMHKISLVVWIYILALSSIINGQVTLIAETLVLNENNPVTLTYTYTGPGSVLVFGWYEVIGDVGGDDDKTRGTIKLSTCTVFSVTPDSSKYNYSCAGNGAQMSWTIKNVDRSNDGDTWACSVTLSTFIYSNGVSIDVREQEPHKENIGTIVGAFVGGLLIAGLVAIAVVAVVFLLRRLRATKERESDNQQPIGLDQADATKTTDYTSNHSIERPTEQMNDPSNNEAAYNNEGSVAEYQTLDEQHRDFTTYTSLQPSNDDTTGVSDLSTDENKTYENLTLQAII